MPFLYDSPLGYASDIVAARIWKDDRDPTTVDYKNFTLGDIWLNTPSARSWILVDRTSTTGIWVQMASTGTGILTLTGNSGGAIGPDGSNNVNLLGAGTLTVTGSGGTNTLTISQSGLVATSYVEDAGSAIPAANILNIVGGMGITTSGAGNTVTISSSVTTPLTFTEDSASATPAANNINIFGTGGITTSGAGDTVTITASGSVIGKTITGDTGGALSPTAGNWNILGGTGCNTSGSGSTLTINVTGGFDWNEVTVVGPTQMAISNGYVSNSASLVQLTLPLTSVFGSSIKIVGKGSGGWQINQNAGQSIVLEASSTTAGVTGTLTSNAQRDVVELLCTTADTVWTIISGVGNYTFT